MRYLFKYGLIYSLLITPAFAKKDCKDHIDDVLAKKLEKLDYEERSKYGVSKSGNRVMPPNICTPLMSKLRMIPLKKRSSAGTLRERFMDADCNVYEWDYQHGAFEKYNYKKSGLSHAGEVSAVYGVEKPEKTDSKRDYVDSDTGYPGMDLKRLCDSHKQGKVVGNQKLGLKCN